MLRIDGTMIESKFSNGIITTAKNPFLPMAVNVASKDATPEWHPVRVYASEAELANLRERVKVGGNLLVRGGVSLYKRVSESDGRHYADVVFNTNPARLEVYDRDAKGFRRLAEVLGEEFVPPEREDAEPEAAPKRKRGKRATKPAPESADELPF